MGTTAANSIHLTDKQAVRRNLFGTRTFEKRTNAGWVKSMNTADYLRIQYDCISKTVLLQCGDQSHVLEDRFQNKDTAEDAAKRFAKIHWGYSPSEKQSHH